jgi:hypothetical protein
LCGQYDWHKNHRCPPEFEWHLDGWHVEDEWETIRATDAEDAAERAAAIYDQDDYSLMRGNEVTILVRDPRTKEVTAWSCQGEAVPQYSATQIETPNAPR